MKNFFLIVAVLACLGVAVAIAVTNATGKPLVRNGQQEEAEQAMAAVREATRLRAEQKENAAVPTAYCESPHYDFGLMDPLTVASHVFVIENRSSVPLILQGGDTSCKCTLSDLEEAVVEPGDSYSVELTWNSGHARQEFKQAAMVRTNDPTNPEIQLSISGEVKAVLAALPNTIQLDRLLPEKEFATYFTLYSQTWDSFDIVRAETTNPHFSAAEFFGNHSQVVAFDDELQNATAQRVVRLAYDGLAKRGQLSGFVRLSIRPPQDWQAALPAAADAEHDSQNSTAGDAEADGLPSIGLPLQDDGTILAEIPFDGTVIRRVSLYGKTVKGDGSIALGTISPSDSQGSKWNIIGRIRGDLTPDKVTAQVIGIPGLRVVVEPKQSERYAYSFGLTLELTENLKPAIYNREQAGKLHIEAVGLPDSEGILDMPVSLIVVGR